MPFINIDSLLLIKDIENSIDIIKKEFVHMRENNLSSIKPNVKTYIGQNLTYGEVFTYPLKLDRNLLDESEKKIFDIDFKKIKKGMNERLKYCKYLGELIKRYPEIRQCYFNEAHSKSKIQKHYGVNGITKNSQPDHFRLQVTINPGNNCFFFIENQREIIKMEYKSGIKFGFRDGLDMHWIENNGNETRTVLIIDIDRTKETDNLPVLI